MAPTVTSIYAGLCGLLYLVLAALVVRARWQYRVSLGTGTHAGMERAVRVHANFAEYVPLTLMAMLLSELTGLPATPLHAAGCVLVLSRVVHAWGLSHHSGRSLGRFYGTLGTWLVLAGLSLNLVLAGLLRA